VISDTPRISASCSAFIAPSCFAIRSRTLTMGVSTSADCTVFFHITLRLQHSGSWRRIGPCYVRSAFTSPRFDQTRRTYYARCNKVKCLEIRLPYSTMRRGMVVKLTPSLIASYENTLLPEAQEPISILGRRLWPSESPQSSLTFQLNSSALAIPDCS
jgi:hypothetical protein